MFKNKRIYSFVLAMAMILGMFVFPGQVKADAETVKITILGTTDLHSNIYDWSYEDGKENAQIGMAKVYSVVEKYRKENPNIILIDNGDTIQGTILADDLYNTNMDEAHPVIDVMNFMKYDAMVLGNHEFNFGLDLVSKIEKEAKFSMLAANLTNKKDGSLLVKPYTVVERAGIKIGILGFTNPNIPRWDGAKVTELEFTNMAASAKEYIKELKEIEKVDVIIGSAHAGIEPEYGNDSVREIIEKNPEFAAFLVGHTHGTEKEKIGSTVVGGGRDQGREVVKFELSMKKVDNKWTLVDNDVEIIVTEEYKASEELKTHGKKYHDNTLKFLEEVIGKATEDFHPASSVKGIPEAQIKDTGVIDLINDVQLKATGADIAGAALFQPNSNLKAGNLTYASIFNIYKYPNTLIGVEVNGKELKAYMEWSAKYYNQFKDGDVNISFNEEIRGYNYDMFQGVDYKVDISKPEGSRIVDLKFKGKEVKDTDKFKLAINNYRYGGLKNMKIIPEEREAYFESDPKSLRAYIADHIREAKNITPKVDNNWEVIGADLNHPLKDYILGEVNKGTIVLPKSKDGRTDNVKSLNAIEMIKEGLIPEEILKKHNIEVPKSNAKKITIVHLNDIHGRVKPDEREKAIGFSRLKTKIDELKADNPNVLVLNAGDTFHGTTLINVTEGETMVNLMNKVGFDAMVPGNHDFNFGNDRLLELAKMAKFPIIGSNIIKEADGKSDFTPYTIKEVDGIKVGIFGLTTDETKFKSHPKNTVGIKFDNAVKVSEKMVKELKEQGADIIIALGHLGIEGTTTMTSKEVLEGVKGIDLFIDGHSHEILNQMVGDTLLVQADSYTKNIGIVELEVEDKMVTKKAATLFTYEEAQALVPDVVIEEEIKKIDEINAPITEVVVGKSKVELVGERGNVRTGETNLGNLITDAMLKSTGADIALTNGGGIRSSIKAGDVKVNDIFTAFPFTNTLAVIEVTGIELMNALERGVDSYPEEAGHFAHVAGMTYTFDPEKPVGNRVVEVLVNGKALDLTKKYKLVTNDFMAAGGDGYTMFEGKPFVGEGGLLSDVLIEHMKEMGEVSPTVEGRMKVGKGTEVKPTSPVAKKYIVKPGDALWKIGNMFNTPWKQLAEFNNLKNPNLIYPNQEILIPEMK